MCVRLERQFIFANGNTTKGLDADLVLVKGYL